MIALYTTPLYTGHVVDEAELRRRRRGIFNILILKARGQERRMKPKNQSSTLFDCRLSIRDLGYARYYHKYGRTKREWQRENAMTYSNAVNARIVACNKYEIA